MTNLVLPSHSPLQYSWARSTTQEAVIDWSQRMEVESALKAHSALGLVERQTRSCGSLDSFASSCSSGLESRSPVSEDGDTLCSTFVLETQIHPEAFRQGREVAARIIRGERVLKPLNEGENLADLIARIISPDNAKHGVWLRNIFFAVVPLFANTSLVLDVLLGMFSVQNCGAIRSDRYRAVILKTLAAIKYWARAHPQDFDRSSYDRIAIITSIADPSIEHITRDCYHSFRGVGTLLDHSGTLESQFVWSARELKLPRFPCSIKRTARVLTFMQRSRMAYIGVRDICVPEKSQIDEMAKSNVMSEFVTTEIVFHSSTKAEQRRALKFWISVATSCIDRYSNFNTAFEITIGILSHSLFRLRYLFDTLPRQSISHLTRLEDLVDPTRNYDKYRNALSFAPTQQRLPYIGVLLKDANAIVEGAPPSNSCCSSGDLSSNIPFSKYSKAANMVSAVLCSFAYQDDKADEHDEFSRQTICYRISLRRNHNELLQQSYSILPRGRSTC